MNWYTVLQLSAYQGLQFAWIVQNTSSRWHIFCNLVFGVLCHIAWLFLSRETIDFATSSLNRYTHLGGYKALSAPGKEQNSGIGAIAVSIKKMCPVMVSVKNLFNFSSRRYQAKIFKTSCHCTDRVITIWWVPCQGITVSRADHFTRLKCLGCWKYI